MVSLKKVQVDNMEKILEEDMKLAMEGFLKEMQYFPDEIRDKILEVVP